MVAVDRYIRKSRVHDKGASDSPRDSSFNLLFNIFKFVGTNKEIVKIGSNLRADPRFELPDPVEVAIHLV